MTPVMVARLALALMGLILFGYGVRADEERIRLFGIAFLAAATLLRWWPRPRPPAG